MLPIGKYKWRATSLSMADLAIAVSGPSDFIISLVAKEVFAFADITDASRQKIKVIVFMWLMYLLVCCVCFACDAPRFYFVTTGVKYFLMCQLVN
jgi:hypothetical protein